MGPVIGVWESSAWRGELRLWDQEGPQEGRDTEGKKRTEPSETLMFTGQLEEARAK